MVMTKKENKHTHTQLFLTGMAWSYKPCSSHLTHRWTLPSEGPRQGPALSASTPPSSAAGTMVIAAAAYPTAPLRGANIAGQTTVQTQQEYLGRRQQWTELDKAERQWKAWQKGICALLLTCDFKQTAGINDVSLCTRNCRNTHVSGRNTVFQRLVI